MTIKNEILNTKHGKSFNVTESGLGPFVVVVGVIKVRDSNMYSFFPIEHLYSMVYTRERTDLVGMWMKRETNLQGNFLLNNIPREFPINVANVTIQ